MTANTFTPLASSRPVRRATDSATDRGLSLVMTSFGSCTLSSVISRPPDPRGPAGTSPGRQANHPRRSHATAVNRRVLPAVKEGSVPVTWLSVYAGTAVARGTLSTCQKGRTSVGFAALITWFAAVLAGLYMLTVWLIENDVTGRHAARSQLRVPVIFTHLTLAVSGLCVWVASLVLDRDPLAWTALGVLATVILLGLTMFARWLPVYREPPVVAAAAPAPGPAWPMEPASSAGRTSTAEQVLAAPAESHFPVAVIAAHGLLAGATLVLVLLTMLGIGGS